MDQKVSIYTISYNDQVIYVGSTNDINHRERQHKYDMKKRTDIMPIYKYIRENQLDFSELKFTVMAECYEKDRSDAEGLVYDQYVDSCLNKKVPGRTESEYQKVWYQDNKDKIREYNQVNKDKISEYQIEYREQNRDKIREKQNEKIECPCGINYTLQNKLRHFRTNTHKIYLHYIKYNSLINGNSNCIF